MTVHFECFFRTNLFTGDAREYCLFNVACVYLVLTCFYNLFLQFSYVNIYIDVFLFYIKRIMVVVVFVRCFVYYNADLCIINDNYKSLAKTKITRISCSHDKLSERN